MEVFKELKQKALATDYPKWRNLLAGAFLFLISTGTVATFGYLFATTPALACREFVLYFSAVWLIAQWLSIGYLYLFNGIPAFARGAVHLLILMGNVWFILFIFSLRPCT